MTAISAATARRISPHTPLMTNQNGTAIRPAFFSPWKKKATKKAVGIALAQIKLNAHQVTKVRMRRTGVLRHSHVHYIADHPELCDVLCSGVYPTGPGSVLK